MEKYWLKSYPEGVPHDIDPEQYRSLTQLLEESFKKNAARPFSVCMERWMTYGQLDELSAALGAWLQAQGLEPGARVAIMLPNIPQFAVTMAAVLRAGYTCVNVNPLYTARELEHQLRGLGRDGDRHPRELRQDAGRGDRAYRRQARGHRLDGRSAGVLVRPLDHVRGPASGQDGARLPAAPVRGPQGHDVQEGRRGRRVDDAQAQRRKRWIRWLSCSTPAEPPGCPRARS